MLKRASLFLAASIILVLASCSNQGNDTQKSSTTLSPKEIAHKVGKQFGNGNVRVIKAEKTNSDSNGEPMYLMMIEGNFTKGSKTAKYLRFSATADKFYYWALEASKDKNFNQIVWSKE